MAADHNSFANLIWQIADLLRGPVRAATEPPIALPKEPRSALSAAAVTGQLDLGTAA